ncbi:MAG: site-specific DNA-methyltransferase [bacterium]
MMKKMTAKDAETKSADVIADNVTRLKALFPDLITEGKQGVSVNVDVLKALVGDKVVTVADEKYGLNWHGKRQSRQLALTPSTGTLRPCPDESVDWDKTQNLMIEGDNLEVLKLLQKSYAGKVKLIFIDPPYNTGKDFVYPDNFQDNIKNYLEITGQIGKGGSKLSSNTETSGRFHTDWLNMMYPRLIMARNLLREDGVLFLTIDDNETHNVRQILNEVFGEENFVANVVWNHTKQSKNDERHFSRHHNQIMVFQKSESLGQFRFERTETDNEHYSNPDKDPKGNWRPGDVRSPNYRETLCYPIKTPSGKKISPPENGWRWSEDTLKEKISSGEIIFSQDETRIVRKIYLSEQDGRTPENLWLGEFAGTTRQANAELKEFFGESPFDTPKPVLLIQKIVSLASVAKGDIILDFFAGSGSSGQAVLEQCKVDEIRRRYILVQLPEPLDPENKDQKVAAEYCAKLKKPQNIAELTKERLRRAGKKIKKENHLFAGDLGFRVFKLDSSNILVWEPDRTKLAETLECSIEHLKTDRTETDILFELHLKLGLDLCVPIEEKTIAGKMVQSVGAGTLLVCLASKISRKDAEPLALGIVKWHKDLAPAGESTVVFRDSAFADDVAKTNVAAILEQHGLTNVRSL